MCSRLPGPGRAPEVADVLPGKRLVLHRRTFRRTPVDDLVKSDTDDETEYPEARDLRFTRRPWWWPLRRVLFRSAPPVGAPGPQTPTSPSVAAQGVGTVDDVGGPPARRRPAPATADVALEQWWSELPRSRRRQAFLLASDDSVPEDLVVTLLLYGVLVPEDVAPLGRVLQPPEMRLLITRELRSNCAHT